MASYNRRPRRLISQISSEVAEDGRLTQSQRVSRKKRTDGAIKKIAELSTYPKTEVLFIVRWASPERTFVFDSKETGDWGNLQEIVCASD
jgi:hypothetical protein